MYFSLYGRSDYQLSIQITIIVYIKFRLHFKLYNDYDKLMFTLHPFGDGNIKKIMEYL